MNLIKLQNQLRSLEKKYQRQPESIVLLAVSKRRTCQEIESAVNAGQKDFGESYLQEALPKIRYFEKQDLNWHFIGPIQSNKSADIAKNFSWVHSVDREKIAKRLNEQRPESLPPLNVCIQVNISQEASKSGVDASEVDTFAAAFSQWPNLKLRGLMTMPLPSDDFSVQRQSFRKLSQIFADLCQAGYELDTLSMGTSADLEAAVAEGSTIVRIGTAIFGPRDQ